MTMLGVMTRNLLVGRRGMENPFSRTDPTTSHRGRVRTVRARCRLKSCQLYEKYHLKGLQ